MRTRGARKTIRESEASKESLDDAQDLAKRNRKETPLKSKTRQLFSEHLDTGNRTSFC